LSELDTAISKLSCGKAAGSDGIPNEVWKCLNAEQKEILLDTLNNCWNTLSFPDEWSEIIISPIYKKGDKRNPGNYRPISLMNTGLKLYTMLMSSRLNDWCERNKKVSDYQAAYRKGYGCEDHLFVLNAVLQANVSKRRKVFALFIDLSKAFDSIRHDMLWSKLHKIGLSNKFIANIQALYSHARAKIRTRFGQSCTFPLNNSVFHGETLSPKLFTLFIEDIVNILRNAGVSSLKIGKAEIDILLYADDMIVLAYNSFDLQTKINVLAKYFIDNNLQINLDKTKIVVFRLGNSKYVKPKVFWEDHVIDIVDSYTYLGVPLYGKMLYAKTADDLIVKGKRALRDVFSLFSKAKINNLSVRLTLFESLAKSVVMYGYHIWGINFTDKLKSFQHSFLKQLFRMPQYTPRWFILLESCCKRIELSLVKNLLFFWLKIMSKPKESLIYMCYEGLMVMIDKSKMKHNWCRDMLTVLASHNCDSLISADTNASDKAELLIFRALTSKALSEANTRITETLLCDMNRSVKNPLYKSSRTHILPDIILNSNLSWCLITLYIQLKASVPRISYKNRTVNLNAIHSYFDPSKLSEADNCKLCALETPETLYHAIFVCSGYTPIRKASFHNHFAPKSELEFFCNIGCLNREILMQMYGYVGKMLKIRDEWENDYL
jgi:hypothetical protein